MAERKLENKRIAIVCTTGVERVELTEPKKALEEAGAKVDIITPEGKPARSIDMTEWKEEIKATKSMDQANPNDYDALLLPGGVMNPDFLRMDDSVIRFIRDIGNAEKPIAAICHGPWTLINAGLVKGRTLTSFPSLARDLQNAGARWVNEETVTDGNLLTSRNPDDIPAFCKAMIELFATAQ